jgi:hypothetical protein
MAGSGQAQSCLICSYRDSEPARKPGSVSMEHAPPRRSVARRVTLGQDKLPPRLTASENKVTLKDVHNSTPVQPFFCYHQNIKLHHCLLY